MAVVAAFLESRSAILTLRRAMPRGGPAIASCRTPRSLERLLSSRLVEAVVTAPRLTSLPVMARLIKAFPEIPRVMFAPFRPDDGDVILDCHGSGAVAVAVEGVDDAVLGDLVNRVSLSAERRASMMDAPRVLRLNEALQRKVWEYLLMHVGEPERTASVAERFAVSREHLSRQFGAGGAPNLKRVIDLTRIACASQLLKNPGYTAVSVARILNFASSSHLSDTARRVAGVSAGNLAAVGPRGVLAAFVKGKMRSHN